MKELSKKTIEKCISIIENIRDEEGDIINNEILKLEDMVSLLVSISNVYMDNKHREVLMFLDKIMIEGVNSEEHLFCLEKKIENVKESIEMKTTISEDE